MVIFFFKLIILYLTAAIYLGLIPVNLNYEQSDNGIDIYIASNGVHTDFVLPVTTSQINWQEFFGDKTFQGLWSNIPYIAFGWGDEGFYLHTPEWRDLKPAIAIRALFIPSPSAMHVTLWPVPETGNNIRRISVSREQYQRIIEYIKYSFLTNKSGDPVLIDYPGYTSYDLFFKSGIKFHLFRTCNVWTNTGLRYAGIRSAIWAPFDKTILFQLSTLQ